LQSAGCKEQEAMAAHDEDQKKLGEAGNNKVAGGRISRRGVVFGALGVPLLTSIGPRLARAETKNVRIMMDWIIQGTHAPFFIAQKQSYFKDGGVTVDAIDAGKGATNVAVSVASGAYQFGWVDLPSMIRFNAMNPSSPLIAVYISFDDSPLAVVTRADAGIRKPADLDGKKIAGGPGTAVHDTISILLKSAHAENVNVDWVNVQPQLFGPMLKRGDVVGTGGFTNSNVPAALDVGFQMNELFVVKYADFGANMYGLTLVTTQKFADENPETVRGIVAALNHGTKDTIADPDRALEVIKEQDPMMKMDIEKIRLSLALDLTKTPHVVQSGLSVVDPKKLQFTIDSIADAYKLPAAPDPKTVYTEKFLPPLAERKI
jgi:NitT/TauT family transport system substrate-binding protein